MLHIILHILAIIGIIILCILGLLILLILLVLLCPLRYRIKGSKQDKEILFSAKLSYLFHIITARFSYPDPGNLEVRIFGIRLNLSEKKDVKGATDDIKTDLKDEAAQKDSVDKKQTEKETSERATDNHSIVKNFSEEGSYKQNTDTSFIRHPIIRMRNICKKIYYTLKRLYDKIKHIIQNITYYKDVLTDPANQALYKRLKDRVLTILKKIVPRHFNAEVTIGTGSPDTTGYICGLYGILIPLLGNHMNFTADFEQVVCNGHFEARGHIRLMTILIQAAKVYFDKQLWIFIKQLKREE